MKRSTKIKIIVFFIVFFLCFVDLRPLFMPKKSPIVTTPTIDETRKSYNNGSCYDMTNDLCYLIIYLDDTESNWNESEKNNFMEKKFLVSLDYLSRKASDYSVTLSTKYTIYPDNNTSVRFNGIIESDVVENGRQEDILNNLAISMGYSSPEEMDSSLKDNLGVSQLAYLLVANKNGRSYKYSYVTTESRTIEFCVFFDDAITYYRDTCNPTVAHEILHLFGAEDYYDPYGKMPEREKLAKELYPNDIMLTLPKDVNDAEIGPYTAYCLGWTNTLPKECNVDNWWK